MILNVQFSFFFSIFYCYGTVYNKTKGPNKNSEGSSLYILIEIKRQ